MACWPMVLNDRNFKLYYLLKLFYSEDHFKIRFIYKLVPFQRALQKLVTLLHYMEFFFKEKSFPTVQAQFESAQYPLFKTNTLKRNKTSKRPVLALGRFTAFGLYSSKLITIFYNTANITNIKVRGNVYLL